MVVWSHSSADLSVADTTYFGIALSRSAIGPVCSRHARARPCQVSRASNSASAASARSSAPCRPASLMYGKSASAGGASMTPSSVAVVCAVIEVICVRPPAAAQLIAAHQTGAPAGLSAVEHAGLDVAVALIRSPRSRRVSRGAVTNTDPILAEQLAYYRARAREYDKWFRREGLHDLGEEHNARWRLELNRVFSALDAFAPRGDVLELAYGTGEWTIRLAESAARVVGVDAAPEMRELALAKLQDAGKSNVELRVGDLFSWQPDQDYDVVFFAFWLSHVPESHAYRFWRSVRDALRPGGRFFLVDAARAVPERNVIHGSQLPDRESATELRRLEDGREFRIFKRSFDPDRLARDLRDHGLDASFVETGEFFVYGLGRRA